jgi:hypothetical protein
LIERLRLPVIALLTVVTCLSIHELGHALAARLTGARITEFQVLSLRPHVRVDGTVSVAQEEFHSAAGSAFFLLVYLVFLLVTSRPGDVFRLTRAVASCHALAELLGWICTCLIPIAETSPNDAAHFLAVSGSSRVTIAAICAIFGLLASVLWWITRPKLLQTAEVAAHTDDPNVGLAKHAAQS